MRGELFVDGGCRPSNPGPAGVGIFVALSDGTEHEQGRYIGWRSNNYAEYTALITGILFARKCGATTSLQIYTDSKLIKHQVDGSWRCLDPELVVLRNAARAVLENYYYLDNWWIKWIRRERNKRADALCTGAILAHSSNPFIPAARQVRNWDPISQQFILPPHPP